MDETPINLENILEQAPKWTFAGDFTLLQWMNQISQDLETRATRTTEALTKLNNNIRSTNIALDNVANSLTTLQFGNQFVECRVQDDDETLANEATGNDSVNSIEHTPTSKEILNKFLDNNLKVLRNCHEKYSIDLDDSDEDEEEKSKEKTCIYQPINPYNEKPLPFIFGSKDWHAKWHVGLYENQQENNYSGDEISEAFSESSSTSHLDDNESFESNTEWASSNSIDNDNLNTNIEVKNATTLRGSQPLHPGTPSIPINVARNTATISESSSLSTPSSSLAKKPLRTTKQTDNLTQRSESKTSLNSKISSKESIKVASHNKETPPMQYRQQPQPFVDLFAEPPEDLESSTTSSSVSSAQNIIRPADNKPSLNTERPPVFATQPPPPFVDLFAEPPEDIPSSTASSSISSGRNIKRKTVNLFDDDEDDLAKDDLLTALTKKEELVATKNEEKKTLTPAKATIIEKPITKTPKTLFEDSDDDDDDDFLKAFTQKTTSKAATKNTLTKTLLFDNDFLEPSLETNSSRNLITHTQENTAKPKVRDIFNDPEDNENDLFVKETKDESKLLTQKPKITDDANSEKPVVKTENAKKSVNLFNDSILEQPVAENKKLSVNLFDDFEDEPKSDNLSINKKPKKINLFDDLEDEDGDDLFSNKTKQISIKNIPRESSLKENQIKSLEETNKQVDRQTIVEKINENIPAKSSLKDNEAKTLVETNKQIETEVIVNKSAITVEENNEIKKTVSEDPAIERNTSKKESILRKTEEKEHVPVVNDNKVLDNKENKTSDQSKLFNNDENLIAKDTKIATETSIESSNVETKKTPLDHKELNNNDSKSMIPEKTVPIAANASQTSNTSNKYDFNSVLLFDEPPEDDNAFFETLTKTPQALNNNYNAIDLEHDLYEPDLPKVPVTSASNNQTDSAETRPNNLYTGLQLFSDIPPDDDEDHGAASDTSNHPTDVNSTKRLHSVFYDDFSETLMALNQNQVVKDIPAHSIFSEEPPPINEELKSTISKDTIDHKVPDVKKVELEKDVKLKGWEIAAKLEEALTKPDNKNDTAAAAKRPVSKLQMPHININVQALLPGANNTLRKTKDEATKSVVIEQSNNEVKTKVPTAQAKEKEVSSLTKPTAEVIRTAETEHILPSVTKNRVRGPAARRPSTRRARQENYRKSMLEETATLESDEENKKLQSKKQEINNPITSPKDVQSQINKEIQKQTKENIKEEIPKTTNPLTSSLFEDKPPEQSNISNISKSLSLENKSKTENLKQERTKSLETSSSKQNMPNLTTAPTVNKNIGKDKTDIFEPKESVKEEIKQKPAPTKASLLFADEEEENDDDDLFKHIINSKTTATTTKTETKLHKNDNIVANLFANNPSMQVTKEQPKPSTSNAALNAHVDANTITTTKPDNKHPQPIKDNDNLFNKSQANTATLSNQLKPKTEITKKPSFFDDEEDDDDADLFKTNIPTKQTIKNSNTLEDRNRIAKSKFKSFLDSESDEEPIVAGLQTTATTTSSHTNTTSTNKIPNVTILSTIDSNVKLFSDSDTDSDDLFGKLSSAKTSNNKTTTETMSKSQKPQIKAQTKSSLFSDDSDADDFPISSKNVAKITSSKSSLKEIKPKVPVQTNTSLFSDVDSDEDDLFGSSAAKVATTIATNIPKATTTNIPNIKAPATTKPIASTAEVTKPKTIADNPLADLL
ncbi:WASH complex subunit 2 [Lucilia sericata]|uniref:WASH complex subunit 2 n=1 Tax=Lucilia sericata TaxID=13632 RepID=UPI0018A85EC8|nr:WASH complex subunit 2 [Lucilia sericata]